MPFKPIQLSFARNPRYIKAYSTLFSGFGQMYSNSGNDISREEFPKGYAIYAFDLTPDMCGSSLRFNDVQRGNFAVDIKFSVAPTAAVSSGGARSRNLGGIWGANSYFGGAR